MLLVLARVMVSVVLFCAPFIGLIVLSGQPENALLLIFPMLGVVPAVIAAMVLFVPAEWLCDRIGAPWLKNLLVPLLGASIVGLAIGALAWADGSAARLLGNIARDPAAFWSGMSLWVALGAVWGLVWRMTDWIARRLRLRRRDTLVHAGRER